MNGIQNRKAQDLHKPFPGCIGRMINIFDLSIGMAGTKRLTEKAHRDGSPVRKNHPDMVKKVIDPIGVQIEDKPIDSELRRSSTSKKLGGTPMKMLIAQEMSKETESKQKAPSIVARLMGLDPLPAQQVVRSASRSSQESYYSCNSLAGSFQGNRQLEDACFDKPVPYEVHLSAHQNKEYKDVYEVWQQPSRTSCIKDQPIQKGRNIENPNERRMALVRQKFMEAKRLATDEKLFQSKEFQDALEVLSSNRDLFIKFLEEPNSLFSKHLDELQTVHPPSQTKRITVLKPSKSVETKGEKELKNQKYAEVQEGGWDTDWSPSFTHSKAESLSQPTRIVVLKPSPGKSHDIRAMVTSPVSSPKLQGIDFPGGLGTDEAIGSRQVAKEITRQMRESMSSNRDEALLSSVLSNGYVGDESSFNRSENAYIEEEGGNFSDSEIVTPTSRRSWDYVNRFGSPYSLSSFSRSSFSPESSVTREAKKRLSERWALVASNGISQEQRQVRRSSSTLGDMLAIPEVKKEEGSDGGLTVSSSRSCGEEQDQRVTTACLSIGKTKGGGGGEDSSPRSLLRSKSVPVSSSAYGNVVVSVEASDSQISKSIVPKEAKSKSAKYSFKGKVSSLFFSKSKKLGRENFFPSTLEGSDGKLQSGNAEYIGNRINDLSECVHDSNPEGSPVVNLEGKSSKASSSTSSSDGPKQGNFSAWASLSLDKPRTSENLSENQDQPSPISVLEARFEDDANNNASQFGRLNAGYPQALSRSPPIESVARSLSWNDTNHFETSLPNRKLSRVLSKEDEEQERFTLVQSLLSSAGLDTENSNTLFARWHSLESPLDPTLLDKFLDRKEEEAKCRERRSSQRLLFDCVNAAMLEIGRTTTLGAYPCAKACVWALKDIPADDAPVTSRVWGLVKDLFSGEGKWVSGVTGNGSLVVDRVVRTEAAGSGWADSMWSEMDEISKEIGGQVLEELFGEALAELTRGLL